MLACRSVNTTQSVHSRRRNENRIELNPRAMKDVTRRFFILLQCLLVGDLVDSSSLSSSTHSESVVSSVGKQAVLPCSWKRRLGDAARSTCHVQWTNPSDTVFELRGERRWQAEEFEGRAEVPEEKLGSGDCSLIIRDVQMGDAGTYDSFMVVDGARSTRTRVFIQSVRLSVSDHMSLQSLGLGEDLVLDLHTPHSMRVVFQGRSGSEWMDVWMRGDEDSERLEKDPLMEQLTVKTLTRADEGMYKVLDGHGLPVSTVQLAVEGRSTALKVQQVWEVPVPTGDGGGRSSRSELLVFALLVFLHLL